MVSVTYFLVCYRAISAIGGRSYSKVYCVWFSTWEKICSVGYINAFYFTYETLVYPSFELQADENPKVSHGQISDARHCKLFIGNSPAQYLFSLFIATPSHTTPTAYCRTISAEWLIAGCLHLSRLARWKPLQKWKQTRQRDYKRLVLYLRESR